MELGHIELFVKNTKVSVIFYRDILGFEHVSDQGEFQWVKSGNIEILLRPGKNQKQKSYQTSSHGLVLYTDKLEQISKTLVEKGLEFRGKDMSENCFTFTDPDGHWFQLVNPNH